ncbi:hypothetical protein COOONC_06001 [Cooperia oncophora]
MATGDSTITARIIGATSLVARRLAAADGDEEADDGEASAKINDSLLYLKEFLLNVSPQQRYQSIDISIHVVANHQAAVYRSGREEGFARGFAHASQAVFNYLQMAMPHDFNPQAQQFHLGLVHHLNAVMPSRTGTACQPIPDPPKWSPGTPPASDISSSESPEPTGSPSQTTRPKEARGERRPHLTREDDSCQEPPSKKVWQPWQ